MGNKLYRHISSAANEAVDYISKRRSGEIKSIKTRWDKFNKATMNGIEPNTLTTIGGISGSGKSSMANLLESDIFDMNPELKDELVVLSFSFEMSSYRQVARKFSNKLNKTTSELFSANGQLEEEYFKKIKDLKYKVNNYKIYYIDFALTVDQISSVYKEFIENEGKDKWVVIILDHTLLTRGSIGEGDRETISNLQKLFIQLKKIGKTTIIQLAQMNRAIETTERINNPMGHYPQRSDIFGSDSIYHASDIVVIIHRPEILQIQEYGLQKLPTKDAIYMHIIKSREGELKILKFSNQLKYNNIV